MGDEGVSEKIREAAEMILEIKGMESEKFGQLTESLLKNNELELLGIVIEMKNC